MTLPDPSTDPAGYVLAVAELREQRVKAATPGPWEVFCPGSEGFDVREQTATDYRTRPRSIAKIRHGDFETCRADAEHITAEANPDHALAEVALWRGIVERHGGRRYDLDLRGAVEAAKAYDQTKELG